MSPLKLHIIVWSVISDKRVCKGKELSERETEVISKVQIKVTRGKKGVSSKYAFLQFGTLYDQVSKQAEAGYHMSLKEILGIFIQARPSYLC